MTADTEHFAKPLRKAMLAAEAIAGETDRPPKERAAALRRLATFWTALADEMDPPRVKREED